MKTTFGFLFSFFILLNFSFSQDTHFCKTAEMVKLMEEKNPLYKQGLEQLETETQQYVNNPLKANQDQIYIIPIVFHIVHNYGDENISREQILDEVRILNEDFRKLNADTNQIVSAFKSIAADCYIQFRLAQIDPNGNCTEGITRTVSDLTVNANDNVKYVAPAWPREKYFNVWVVRTVEGAAGYAYYPSNWLDADVDGVLIDDNYVGHIGTGDGTRCRALTHEIGHSMNLAHPWGDSNEPGVADNCNTDDGVSDTPNTVGWTSCNLSGTSCGSLDNVQNYMEYSYCSKMFTLGQKDRMRAALNSSISSRNSLWQSSNLVATGTNDGYTSQVCVPMADFQADYTEVCNGYEVNFNDLSYNAAVDSTWQWSWSFPGGTPSTSTEQNPMVIYPSAGNYNVTLNVSNASGSDQITKSSFITVLSTTVGEMAPYTYGFENSNFPSNADPNKIWKISQNGNYTWERTTSAYSAGIASAHIRNWSNDNGTVNTLISPNIIMGDNVISASMYFKLAYAKRTTDSYEYLKMFVSPNCGKSWFLRYARSGTNLVTNGGTIVSTTFVPTSSDWRQENVSLSTYADSAHLRLKFEITSSGGNYLYIDDINISIVTSDNPAHEISPYVNIFPNPINNETVISYSIFKYSDVSFRLYDITGRILAEHQISQAAGNYEIQFSELAKNLPFGTYILSSTINGNRESFGIVKTASEN